MLSMVRTDDELLSRFAAGDPEAFVEFALSAADRYRPGERPYAEIAAEMRCSEMLVRQRVSRGLRALRGLVGRDEEEPR